MGRKSTAANALMGVDAESTWSFQNEGVSGPPSFRPVKLTIDNAGGSRDVVALRESADLLPLQPRRLAVRFEAPWQPPTVNLGAVMADLREIKRALNEERLLKPEYR